MEPPNRHSEAIRAGRGEDMRIRVSPATLARASSRHPWRTLVVWLVVIAAMGAVSNALLAGTLTQDIAFTNKPESVKAQDIIDQKFSGGTEPDSTEFFIVQSDSLTVDDPQFQAHVQGVTSRIAALGSGILAGKAVSYYDAKQHSPDAASALV